MKGQRILHKGFLEVVPKSEIGEKLIPDYQVGQKVEVQAKRITEGKVSNFL
jgi:DNA topoisomerase IA